jgi:ComF family protein
MWVLPYICTLCGRPSDRKQDLCSACLKDLPIVAHKCSRCGVQSFSEICGQCLKHPPPFTACYSLFAYEPPLTYLILSLKFRQDLVSARILGELLAEQVKQQWYRLKPLPDFILPVPLHENRLKERGFNQALEVARPISRALKIEILTQAVRRVKDTPAQMQLMAEDRKKNVRGVFSVEADVTGKHIVIVDDVVTTGATAAEIARVLLKQGARMVEVWCCGRTV